MAETLVPGSNERSQETTKNNYVDKHQCVVHNWLCHPLTGMQWQHAYPNLLLYLPRVSLGPSPKGKQMLQPKSSTLTQVSPFYPQRSRRVLSH
jgi:hypothetical protein